jgi:hypothetical protein
LTFEHMFGMVTRLLLPDQRGVRALIGTYELIQEADRPNARICAEQRVMLEAIRKASLEGIWEDFGARDTAHLVSMRYDVSCWKADRWVKASHALEHLPELSDAFSAGEIGIDKVVELTRFATADTEAELLSWAQRVSSTAVRQRADVEIKQRLEDAREVSRARYLEWWYEDQGRRMGIRAELPAAQGAVVIRAIDRMAAEIPVMPGEDQPHLAQARRADALVALCSAKLAHHPNQDRATIVVHAKAGQIAGGENTALGIDLVSDGPGVEIEGGGVIHPATLGRLLCNARAQTVFEDEHGEVIGVGRVSREPSAWMMRQIRYRDRECRFPGCGHRRFTQAHHIRWWRHGGRTDLDNLVLICSFHHDLVHEHGWAIRRRKDGRIRWRCPMARPTEAVLVHPEDPVSA